ncbi:MAG: zinc ribbon domain-containing protein [Chloroflexota bacterium]|nr:zinc ribbon domain-containing protein [Chloroflexota bacterium]
MSRCPQCTSPNPNGARFCSTCGAPLARAAVGRVVRKPVTVLFADITGSTALGERLDPEAVRDRTPSIVGVEPARQ